MKETFESCKSIIREYLDRVVEPKDILYLSFNHRNKHRLRGGVWFAVKLMYLVYQNRTRNKSQLLRDIVKEIDWNLDLNRKIGSKKDLLHLKQIILNQIE